MTTTSTPTAAATSANPVRQPSAEIRLAVAMNGGVSLAVWIGGVTEEILHLVRSSPARTSPAPSRTSAYAAALDLVDSDVTVDVISGASAGGINGGLLGFALARGMRTVNTVRTIWIETGDIKALLRPATIKDAPSLLQGDYFYDEVVNAFTNLASEPTEFRDQVPYSDGDDDEAGLSLSVRLTASLLSGVVGTHAGSAGTRIIDTDYRGIFAFDHKDLAADSKIRHLSLAARSTASFPVAFEPAWVPLTDDDARRPNMRDHVRPTPPAGEKGLWVVDGGALNNKPINEVLRDVFAQPSEHAVRRAVLYVIPDPGDNVNEIPEEAPASGASADAMPSLPSVLMKSVVTMPRNQSLRNDLDAIERHNAAAGAFSSLRWDLARTWKTNLAEQAAGFEEAYRNAQAHGSATRAAERTRRSLARQGRLTEFDQSISMTALVAALEKERLDHYPKPYLPSLDEAASTYGEYDRADTAEGGGDGTDEPAAPTTAAGSETSPDEDATYWGYGLTSARRIASAPIDLAQRLLRIIPPIDHPRPGATDAPTGPHPLAEPLAAVQEALRESHRQLREILKVETDEAWLDRHAATIFEDDLETWASRYFEEWNGSAKIKRKQFSEVGAAARAAAGQLGALREPARAIHRYLAVDEARGEPLAPDETLGELVELITAIEALTVPGPGWALGVGQGPEWTLRQLLAIELIFDTTTAELTVPQSVELAQVSAYAQPAVGGRPPRTPADKLTGVEVAHFAAFYRRAWRANDYMWGRLDGAARLTRIVFDPDRLKRVHYGRTQEAIKADLRVAATDTPNPDVRAVLEHEWDAMASSEALNREVEAIRTDAAPNELPMIVKAIVRRRQLEIIEEELPVIAKQIRTDADEGAAVSVTTKAFLREAATAFDGSDSRPTYAQLVAAFDACKVGRDEMKDEASSDRFTEITGRSAAVATTTLRTAVPWGWARTGLTWVRGLGVSTYVLSRLTAPAKENSSLMTFLALLAFAIGGAAFAGSIFFDAGGLLASAVAVAVLAVPILVAGQRAGFLKVGIGLLVLLAVTATIWNLDEVLTEVFDRPPKGSRGVERSSFEQWLVDHREFLVLIVAILAFTGAGLAGRRGSTSTDRLADQATT